MSKIKYMQENSDKNNQQLISVLGKIIKNHGEAQNKSIYKISAEASLSKSTWREAEVGACKNMNLSTFWKIAEGLDIKPEELIKEVRECLGKDFTLSDD